MPEGDRMDAAVAERQGPPLRRSIADGRLAIRRPSSGTASVPRAQAGQALRRRNGVSHRRDGDATRVAERPRGPSNGLGIRIDLDEAASGIEGGRAAELKREVELLPEQHHEI